MAKTVFVGLSGGVDSAVSVALLKKQGYNVVGVFIKIWQPEFIECTWAADRLDAMRVAVALDIPFREIDLSAEYQKSVVHEMVEQYSSGITPNPDVLCNKRIKFGSFLDFAKVNGADYIATGHYAQVRKSGNNFLLERGRDTGKDQSYFLHYMDQAQLSRTLFPVGGLLKPEVRTIAARARLPVARKPDSQGLCFIGDVSMKDFLGRFITLKKGVVVDMRGRAIGEHDGTALYTLGQRHGFSVLSRGEKTEPMYVVGIDAAKNIVRVSADRKDAASKGAVLNDTHWIGNTPQFPFTASVQTRYHETPKTAMISTHGSRIVVSFNEPCVASPGQSLVVYDGNVCLGGGAITSATK